MCERGWLCSCASLQGKGVTSLSHWGSRPLPPLARGIHGIGKRKKRTGDSLSPMIQCHATSFKWQDHNYNHVHVQSCIVRPTLCKETALRGKFFREKSMLSKRLITQLLWTLVQLIIFDHQEVHRKFFLLEKMIFPVLLQKLSHMVILKNTSNKFISPLTDSIPAPSPLNHHLAWKQVKLAGITLLSHNNSSQCFCKCALLQIVTTLGHNPASNNSGSHWLG